MAYGQTALTDDQNLAWDLRLTNAKVISMAWLEVIENRDNFSEWFRKMRFFFSTLKHDVLESRMKEFVDDYDTLEKDLLDYINKHPAIYLQKDHDPAVAWEIEKKLRAIEERLTEEITKSNMRGRTWTDDGGL